MRVPRPDANTPSRASASPATQRLSPRRSRAGLLSCARRPARGRLGCRLPWWPAAHRRSPMAWRPPLSRPPCTPRQCLRLVSRMPRRRERWLMLTLTVHLSCDAATHAPDPIVDSVVGGHGWIWGIAGCERPDGRSSTASPGTGTCGRASRRRKEYTLPAPDQRVPVGDGTCASDRPPLDFGATAVSRSLRPLGWMSPSWSSSECGFALVS